MSLSPFHLAIPVTNLSEAREFYVGLLGCGVGREDEHWIDFDFQGHQITAHWMREPLPVMPCGEVDGKQVPVSHFGLVLPWNAWQALADRLRAAGVAFVIEPYIRFRGQVGEQATMFLQDPSGNMLEFKSFKKPANLFAR